MNKRVVSVELPADLFLAVHDLATEQEGTVANVVEDLLIAHLESRKSNRPKQCEPDEKLVFALQKLLFRDLADARDWEDLDLRLRRHGYFMKVAWGGLSLHTETSGQKLCNVHDLGFSYGQFIRRFGPGRPKDPSES
jgi:hypothetical protein